MLSSYYAERSLSDMTGKENSREIATIFKQFYVTFMMINQEGSWWDVAKFYLLRQIYPPTHKQQQVLDNIPFKVIKVCNISDGTFPLSFLTSYVALF